MLYALPKFHQNRPSGFLVVIRHTLNETRLTFKLIVKRDLVKVEARNEVEWILVIESTKT